MCGGRKVATILRSHGCNTIGKLYTHVLDARTASSSVKTTFSNPNASIDKPHAAIGSKKRCKPDGFIVEDTRGEKRRLAGECAWVGRAGEAQRGEGKGVERGKLRRWLRDEDLEIKISSLLLRLTSAFDSLLVSL